MRQQSTASCGNVISDTDTIIDYMKDNPASTLIADLAEKVINASRVVVCSASEIAAVQNLNSAINETESKIAEELDNVQSDLEGEYLGILFTDFSLFLTSEIGPQIFDIFAKYVTYINLTTKNWDDPKIFCCCASKLTTFLRP